MKEDKSNEGRKGGLLKGDAHSEPSGGIKAVVTDSNDKPVLLEGEEVIINKKAVNAPGQKTLKGTNKEILHQINTSTGGKPILAKGGAVNDADTEAVIATWKSLQKQISQKLLELNDKTQWRWFDRLNITTTWDKPMVKHAKRQIDLVKGDKTETMKENKLPGIWNREKERFDLNDVPKSLYDRGDMVYSWQNPDYAAPVAFKEFRRWESNGKPHENDSWAYKVTLKDAEGYTRSSKWMGEDSLSKEKKDKYEQGGDIQDAKTVKELLIADGDNENDYIVEGTRLTTGEGPAEDQWEIVSLTPENITVKHLPKSSLGSSAGERTITYAQLRDDFSRNAIKINGINSGDTRCLNLCIKAIQQALGKESFEKGGGISFTSSSYEAGECANVMPALEHGATVSKRSDGTKGYDISFKSQKDLDAYLKALKEMDGSHVEMGEGGNITADDIDNDIAATKILIEAADYDENGNPIDRDYVNGLQEHLDALEILKNTK